MKPTSWKKIALIAFTAIAIGSTVVRAEEIGRTDGPEESELGTGGYPFGGGIEQFYVTPTFGSGTFGGQTGLLYGVDIGYKSESWIGVQGGYSYLSDAKLHITTLGARFDYALQPFVTYITVQAGLYSQEGGDRNFGVAPGGGIDIRLNDRVRLGIKVAHDFILSDSVLDDDIDRISIGLSVAF